MLPANVEECSAQPGLLGWIHPTISTNEEGRASLPQSGLLVLALHLTSECPAH